MPVKHTMKAQGGVGIQIHLFLNLGTRWRSLVSFMSQPLHPQGECPQYMYRLCCLGPQKKFVLTNIPYTSQKNLDFCWLAYEMQLSHICFLKRVQSFNVELRTAGWTVSKVTLQQWR